MTVSRRVEQAKAFLKFFKHTYKSEAIAEKLVSKVRQRGKLREAVRKAGGIKRRKQQAHHIVPIEAFLQSRLVQKAVLGGFEINGAENGIAFSLSRHKKLHANWGSYNRLVMQELFILEDKFPDCG